MRVPAPRKRTRAIASAPVCGRGDRGRGVTGRRSRRRPYVAKAEKAGALVYRIRDAPTVDVHGDWRRFVRGDVAHQCGIRCCSFWLLTELRRARTRGRSVRQLAGAPVLSDLRLRRGGSTKFSQCHERPRAAGCVLLQRTRCHLTAAIGQFQSWNRRGLRRAPCGEEQGMSPNGPPRFSTRAVQPTSAAWQAARSGKKDCVAKNLLTNGDTR
jgi:hypothetical protein